MIFFKKKKKDNLNSYFVVYSYSSFSGLLMSAQVESILTCKKVRISCWKKKKDEERDYEITEEKQIVLHPCVQVCLSHKDLWDNL